MGIGAGGQWARPAVRSLLRYPMSIVAVCCSRAVAFLIEFTEFVRYLPWFQVDVTGEPYCAVLHDKP